MNQQATSINQRENTTINRCLIPADDNQLFDKDKVIYVSCHLSYLLKMINNALFFALVVSFLASCPLAFVPAPAMVSQRESLISPTTVSIAAIPVTIAHVQMQESFSVPMTTQQQSAFNDGIRSYVNSLPSALEDSSTVTLSLKERPPPPTQEELATKKRNFNLCKESR
jgi:hypothetical protein